MALNEKKKNTFLKIHINKISAQIYIRINLFVYLFVVEFRIIIIISYYRVSSGKANNMQRNKQQQNISFC